MSARPVNTPCTAVLLRTWSAPWRQGASPPPVNHRRPEPLHHLDHSHPRPAEQVTTWTFCCPTRPGHAAGRVPRLRCRARPSSSSATGPRESRCRAEGTPLVGGGGPGREVGGVTAGVGRPLVAGVHVPLRDEVIQQVAERRRALVLDVRHVRLPVGQVGRAGVAGGAGVAPAAAAVCPDGGVADVLVPGQRVGLGGRVRREGGDVVGGGSVGAGEDRADEPVVEVRVLGPCTADSRPGSISSCGDRCPRSAARTASAGPRFP